jgi:hypothetical protein
MGTGPGAESRADTVRKHVTHTSYILHFPGGFFLLRIQIVSLFFIGITWLHKTWEGAIKIWLGKTRFCAYRLFAFCYTLHLVFPPAVHPHGCGLAYLYLYFLGLFCHVGICWIS